VKTYIVTITGTDETEVCAKNENEAKEVAHQIFKDSGWDLLGMNAEMDCELRSNREL